MKADENIEYQIWIVDVQSRGAGLNVRNKSNVQLVSMNFSHKAWILLLAVPVRLKVSGSGKVLSMNNINIILDGMVTFYTVSS